MPRPSPRRCLLKQYLLRPFGARGLRAAFRQTLADTLERVRGRVRGVAFLGQATFASAEPTKRMEHLACFAPGMLALAHKDDPGSGLLEEAEELMETCMGMYSATRTGLAAEAYEIKAMGVAGAKLVPAPKMKFSLLRPEAVESAFVLWRVTGDARYREFGWRVFQAVERHSRLPGNATGYAAVADVDSSGPPAENRLDRLDSFFFAETLKYLYLLFCPPGVLPLSEFVFTTEAHPLPVLERPPYSH